MADRVTPEEAEAREAVMSLFYEHGMYPDVLLDAYRDAIRGSDKERIAALEDVLFEWLWATDEGRLDVTWDRYRAAEVVLGLIPCDLCGGCGGCGECSMCDDRDPDAPEWPNGCPKCDTRGVLNTARDDELMSRLSARRALLAEAPVAPRTCTEYRASKDFAVCGKPLPCPDHPVCAMCHGSRLTSTGESCPDCPDVPFQTPDPEARDEDAK